MMHNTANIASTYWMERFMLLLVMDATISYLLGLQKTTFTFAYPLLHFDVDADS